MITQKTFESKMSEGLDSMQDTMRRALKMIKDQERTIQLQSLLLGMQNRKIISLKDGMKRLEDQFGIVIKLPEVL